MGRSLVASFILTAYVFPMASFGQAPSPVPLDPDWRLVANSVWIVQARLQVPRDEIERDIRTGEGNLVELTLHPVEIIKRPTGDPDFEFAKCLYWTGPQNDFESPKEILAMDDCIIIAFIEPYARLIRERGSISLVKPGRTDRLKKEVLNQRTIAKDFAGLPAAKPDELDGGVKQLISEMLVKETKQDAVYSLQVLGPRAVPSIIRHMDDRRQLPDKVTKYFNMRGDEFGGIIRFHPKVVLDALLPVLISNTDQSFGDRIFDGGTDEERKQVVDAWRVSLHYQTLNSVRIHLPAPAIPKPSPDDRQP
jgi:hypothetical protein